MTPSRRVVRVERCPPHNFEAAGWEDESGRFNSRIFCTMCGEVRALQEPVIPAPAVEMIRSESEQ